MYLRILLALGCFWIMPVSGAPAQDRSAPADEAASKEGSDADREFDDLFREWKDLIAKLRELQLKYAMAKAPERKAIAKEYDELVKKGEAMEADVRKGAEAAFVAKPNENEEVSKFVLALLINDVGRDDYESALRLGRVLAEHKIDNKLAFNYAGIAAFCTSNFTEAQEYLEIAEASATIDGVGNEYLKEIKKNKYQEKWDHELEVRAKEAEADDLPRVKFHTTKGDIVLELFENEAPNTVANFINLVEKGFYSDVAFHRVLPAFMAQGGDPQGDGTGGPGYCIPCECFEPNHRLHFRGSLSMAKQERRDTGGSQFFLNFKPTMHLDGKHTVFGRVIEGLEVLNALQRRDPTMAGQPDPDKIIEATVLRKREHDYVPETLPEK